MAVTLTDRRETIDAAETATGWASDQGLSVTAGSTQPDPIEGANRLGTQISRERGNNYHTHGTAIDGDATNTGNDQEGSTVKTFNGILVYGWIFSRGDPLPTVDGGLGITIGDGTNRKSYYLAGGDSKGFSYDDGAPYYQCLLLDTGNLPANFNTDAGGTINLSALTNFGYWADNGNLKSVGGAENYFLDVIRVGNHGIRIAGGTDLDRGTFTEIASSDSSINNAYGIIRPYSTGIYGLQGPLTFGSTTTSTYFEDSGFTAAFEDRLINNDKYFIDVEGASGQTNIFILRNGTITSAGPVLTLDFTGGNIDTLELDGMLISNTLGTVTFSNLADATGHTVSGCSFNNTTRIDPGLVTFQNNTISNNTNLNGALVLDADGNANWSDLVFNSSGTGHAIEITAIGTYDFTNYLYNGYATSDGTTGNEVIYNNSGGAVTINIVGGDTPTVRNGTGASTTINNNVSVTLTGLKDNTEVRVYEAGTTTQIAGIEDATNGTTDDRIYTFSLAANTNIDIRIFNVAYQPADILGYIVPTSNASLPIQQVFDRNYNNP